MGYVDQFLFAGSDCGGFGFSDVGGLDLLFSVVFETYIFGTDIRLFVFFDAGSENVDILFEEISVVIVNNENYWHEK